MIRARLFLFVTVLCAAGLHGQQTLNDARLRAHFNLETRLTRQLSLHLDQQYRFNNNMSEFRRASFDVGLAWKLNKHVKLLFDYIYIQRMSKRGYWNQQNWYYTALVLRQNADRFRFVFRTMLQARSGHVNSDDAHNYRIYNRNKLSIRYEATKRLTPYVAGEVYLPLNNPQLTGIERTRSQVGLVIRTTKSQQLEFYFMYQAWWNNGDWWDQSDRYPSTYDRRDFIYGIGYGIEF